MKTFRVIRAFSYVYEVQSDSGTEADLIEEDENE
jgi:hypothetical protein